MGRALGVHVVAEGVETEEQAARLRTLGCKLAQGYLFSRPVAPEAVRALLAADQG
jgi:EAL domain-containing protein (putative c-di-GMP-specific phosphodiesterase class I)